MSETPQRKSARWSIADHLKRRGLFAGAAAIAAAALTRRSERVAYAADTTVSGNLVFANATADIHTQGSSGGLRMYNADAPLTASPTGAAIQFWGNGSPFQGQAYIDSGASDAAAVILRTAPTGGTISERLRITSAGAVGVGTSTPGARLHVAGDEQVDGSLTVNGNLTVQGTKSRAVQTASHGMRKLYAVEAPENWFEDIGWASLSQGHVRVNLDPIFFETVDTQIRYAVFLTPIGECNGLYVAGLDPLGFEVRELQGGTSAVEFQYRVIAKARGLANVRLSEFTPVKRGG